MHVVATFHPTADAAHGGARPTTASLWTHLTVRVANATNGIFPATFRNDGAGQASGRVTHGVLRITVAHTGEGINAAARPYVLADPLMLKPHGVACSYKVPQAPIMSRSL